MSDWLKTRGQTESTRLLLSLQDGSQPLVSAVVNAVVNAVANAVGTASALTFLSGPEGGLSATEEALAAAKGFAAVTLGPRVLRAETAPLACLALVALTGPT